jgi:hypothetical protein
MMIMRKGSGTAKVVGCAELEGRIILNTVTLAGSVRLYATTLARRSLSPISSMLIVLYVSCHFISVGLLFFFVVFARKSKYTLDTHLLIKNITSLTFYTHDYMHFLVLIAGMEYLFTSTSEATLMPCGHAIHHKCLREATSAAHGVFKCPICKKITSPTAREAFDSWMAATIASEPLPEEYRSKEADIICHECGEASTVPWHFRGFQCAHCHSYNTANK